MIDVLDENIRPSSFEDETSGEKYGAVISRLWYELCARPWEMVVGYVEDRHLPAVMCMAVQSGRSVSLKESSSQWTTVVFNPGGSGLKLDILDIEPPVLERELVFA